VQRSKKVLQELGIATAFLLIFCGAAKAQTWAAVTPFPGLGAGTAILRTDGNVMVEEVDTTGYATGNWYLLVPNSAGNYENGTWLLWTETSSLGYAPLYFGSAVLPDGRIVFEGGEYNFSSKDDTTLGFVYDPYADFTGTWTSISPPSGWTKIGDAPTVVLARGQFMLGSCCSKQEALLNASTLTWTTTGSGKADSNSEEGWTLLPKATGNDVLTIDTQNGKESELYSPSSGKWSLAGNTPSFLGNKCGLAIVPEMGPAVLRPNGTVFAAGANSKTAIYNSSTGKWSAGPSFPAGYGVADGPAAILPDGNVLVQASNISPCFDPPSLYYEFDGTNLNLVPGPPNAASEASYTSRMLVLPHAGNILHTDGTTDVEVYNPAGSAKSAWKPVITSYPATITTGTTYTIQGTQFNGVSQGAAYGDDAQSATNFPLVRLTLGGSTYYLPTSNFSSMGVQTGTQVVSADFNLPISLGTGSGTLQVVTNGIASKAVTVKLK